ncbi:MULTISPECIES: hypothetical protein [unclassified Staphylococcus]|uniref:hypothetical protein n=1 Tax=unclassified Staphylococcus TaxID=91994 RepID=UPI001951D40E|nr:MULTISPECIES: hypothetical protein [unclassified Staphylococcus]
MKFAKDIVLNILSQMMFIAVQQAILFPAFEKQLGQGSFGWFILIYGVFNVFVVTIATSFTNLYQKRFNSFIREFEYRTAYYSYYKWIIIYFCLISVISSIAIVVTKMTAIEYILLAVLIILTASRMFLMVWYRVRKQFLIILFVNLGLSILYASLYLLNIENVIQILVSFIIIEFIINIVIYLLNKINIKNMLNARIGTFEFNSLNFLMLSGFAASLMNYSDRFIINLLLGASNVTVYYIATLPTKLMLFPFNMMSSVILSYIASTDNITKTMKKKVLMAIPFIFLLVSAISYFAGLLVIQILYPQYLNAIKDIYFIVTLTFGFICIDNIIRSFLLKYYSLAKKGILDATTLVIFVLLSIIFTDLESDLTSIAIAQFTVFLLKVIVEIYIFCKLDYGKIDDKL